MRAPLFGLVLLAAACDGRVYESGFTAPPSPDAGAGSVDASA